jgi:predicted secreted protein
VALKKRLTRRWKLQVNTGTEESPVYTDVLGISSITLNIEANEVDVSDFDSEGWSDSLTTFRSWSIAVQGFDGYTGTSGAPVEDPGQAYLKTKGLLTGDDAYVGVRLYRTDTNKGYEGRATANYTNVGGEVKGAEPFNCNLTGSGELSAYTHTP